MSIDPIYKKNGKWYFLIDSWPFRIGPFLSKEQASKELKKYNLFNKKEESMSMHGYTTLMIGASEKDLGLSQKDIDYLFDNEESELKVRFSEPEGAFVGIIISEDKSDEGVEGLSIETLSLSYIQDQVDKVMQLLSTEFGYFIAKHRVKIIFGDFFR